MKNLTSILLFLLSLGLFAQQNLVPNGDFENGFEGWSQIPGSSVERGFGYNGDGGLKVTRNEGDPYKYNKCQIYLQPGVAYELSAWVRTENATGIGTNLAIEFHDANGKWMPESKYQTGPSGTTDWVKVTHKFVTPEQEGVKYHVIAYLTKGSTGTAYFDCVTVQPIYTLPEIQIIYPLQGQFSTRGSPFRFAVAQQANTKGDDAFRGMSARVKISQGEKDIVQTISPVVGHLVELRCGEFQPGEVVVQAELLDAEGKVIATNSTTLNAVEDAMTFPPEGACIIDEFGRAIVDEKPFLPIGIYMGGIAQDDDLQLVYDSDFNCIMDYNSPAMILPGRPKELGLAGVVEAMDDLHAHGMKAIFSLKDLFELPRLKDTALRFAKNLGEESADDAVEKLVTTLRHHPALLAWYDNDEISLCDRDVVAKRRLLINRLDPFHPTWGVLYKEMEVPFYGSTCDVLGIDPYPIMKDKVSNQKRTMDLVEAATASGQPWWAVPQVFHWGVYQCKNDPTTFPDWNQPSMDQMRGIMLMEAIYGARGFISYSFFDLKIYRIKRDKFDGSEYAGREDFLKNWSDVKQLATMLKDLSPWILSQKGPQNAEFQVTAGKAHAALFRDDATGKPAAMVASVGPDNVDATLTLPKDFPPMKALYGHAKETAPGVWTFSGNDVWGEVLLPR